MCLGRSFVDQIKMNSSTESIFWSILTGNHTRRSGSGSLVWVEGGQEWAVMLEVGKSSGGGGDGVEKMEMVGRWSRPGEVIYVYKKKWTHSNYLSFNVLLYIVF
ncbi:hypothetical protein Hanom_Chr05g00421501 [Helianthus anomalus]